MGREIHSHWHKSKSPYKYALQKANTIDYIKEVRQIEITVTERIKEKLTTIKGTWIIKRQPKSENLRSTKIVQKLTRFEEVQAMHKACIRNNAIKESDRVIESDSQTSTKDHPTKPEIE